jgi:WD40 repeat protein
MSRRDRFPFALVLALLCGTPAEPAERTGPAVDLHGDPLPASAVARLGTVRWRQPPLSVSCYSSLAFSRDGKTLASTGGDGLRFWDVATGRPVGWFPPDEPVHAVAFSADGKTLITEGRVRPKESGLAWALGRFRHWEVGSGKLLHEVEFSFSPDSTQSFPVLSPDGRRFLLNESGNKVRLWDPSTGKEILEIEEELNYRPPVALSSDGKTLALARKDDRLRLYDAVTGKRLGELRREGEGFYAPAFSPDGKTLISSGRESLLLWDVAGCELKREIEGCRGHVAFSPDGRLLACADRRAIRLWEWPALKEVRRFEEHHDRIRALVFSPDGKTLASGQEYTVALWDVSTGKQRNYRPGHQGQVVSLAFAPDGKSLASGGQPDGTAYVWDLATGRPRQRFTGHYRAPVSLAFSPDGGLLASGDGQPDDRTDAREAQVRLWDLKEGRLSRQFTGHFNSIFSLAFSPDGKTLATGGGDARARLWDVASGKRLAQARGGGGRKHVAFAPDGKSLLVAGFSGELAQWRPDLTAKLQDLGESDERRDVEFAAFLPDGKTVCSVEGRGVREETQELRFWDAATGRPLRSLRLPTSTPGPGACALSPDGRTFAYIADGYPDKVIQLWDTASGKRLAELRGHTDYVSVLAFAPDGRTLASGSWDTTILVWDLALARLDGMWNQLLDGRKDAAAVRRLVSDPAAAAAFLKERLVRTAARERRLARLLKELDDDAFAAREAASKELEKMGPGVGPNLRKALEGDPSAEVRLRIERILERFGKGAEKDPDHFDGSDADLALGVLELLEAPEARRALEDLARGPEESAVTRAAKAALERVRKRAPSR